MRHTGVTLASALVVGLGLGLAAVPLPAAGSSVHHRTTTVTRASTAAARPRCGPLTTRPRFSGSVPTPRHVLGYKLGAHEATDHDIATYLHAVDAASTQVVTGVFAHSWQHRALHYALVGSPRTMRRLPAIRANLARLRQPGLSAARAHRLIRHTPTMLWVTANVHGNEPSGGDAVLKLLYHLADRHDCVARRILRHALVGLIPTQNPDGRTNDLRTNSYAFDMNRDWFARTQPETAGKLDLLWRYPPQLYVDEHENSGSDYFFPPDADPIYHETPDSAYQQVLDLYGKANAAAFTANGWDFETYQSGYDLFYQGYGDTVPTTELGAVGMTFEQGDEASYPVRTNHQFTSALVSVWTGATHHHRVLTQWRRSWMQAQHEGRQCRLEPNHTFNPGNHVQRRVPHRKVCGYFLLDQGRETRLLVRRLQLAHVRVDRLTASARVADFRPYGKHARAQRLPAGTYWVSLAQPGKHWIQAMLNEDTYVPFPYFYDLSGWSNPLLMGIDGGSTGHRPHLSLHRVAPLAAPAAPSHPATLPRIGIIDQRPDPTYEYQTTGWLRWRLGQEWKLTFTALTPSQVTAANLAKLDVLLVPDVDVQPTYDEMGPSGQSALRAWVQSGGRYVGWQGGTSLAGSLGLSSVKLKNPKAESPGALIKLTAPYPHTYAMWEDYDYKMTAGHASVIASFPAHPFVSGFADHVHNLSGSALEAVDVVGSGSATVFSNEPNFRAFSDATARLLFDAIFATPAGVSGLAPHPLGPMRPSMLSQGHTTADHLAHETAGRD